MPSLWLLIAYCHLWGKDFLIHGDVQHCDGVNSLVQSTCWITAAFKQTISPDKFICDSLKKPWGWSTCPCLAKGLKKRILEKQPMANIKNRIWSLSPLAVCTMLSKVYHHCHFNSSWTRECHTMGQVIYAEKSITSLHWDHRVNSQGILVDIISSFPNIHMVWYLQRSSTPCFIQISH